MTAPAADPVCLCGDRRSEHRLGRRGCKALDCGCGEFDPADAMTVEFAEKSTSARLREVEAERDELARLVDQKQTSLLESSDLLTACRARVEAVEHERDANMTASARAARKLIEERDGAAEQWAKARARIVELEQLLADAALKLVGVERERDGWRDRALHFEERAVDQLAATVQAQRAQVVEIHGWNAFQCLTCGNRYRIPFNHEHPLTPVRVSITERQEHHPL